MSNPIKNRRKDEEWALEDQLFLDISQEPENEEELMDIYLSSLEAEDDEFDED